MRITKLYKCLSAKAQINNAKKTCNCGRAQKHKDGKLRHPDHLLSSSRKNLSLCLEKYLDWIEGEWTMDMVSPWNTPITLRKLFEYNRVWVYIQRIKRRERDDWTIFPRPHLSIPFLWINYLMGVYRLYFLHNDTLLNKSLFTQSLIDGGHGQALQVCFSHRPPINQT